MKNVFLEFFSNYLPELLLSIQILQFTFHFNSKTFFIYLLFIQFQLKQNFKIRFMVGNFLDLQETISSIRFNDVMTMYLGSYIMTN